MGNLRQRACFGVIVVKFVIELLIIQKKRRLIMRDEVKEKLSQRCNCNLPLETYLDFIRSSEYEFKMEEKSFENINIEKLDEYIDFLDYLWEK
jgi:hypothetical protein